MNFGSGPRLNLAFVIFLAPAFAVACTGTVSSPGIIQQGSGGVGNPGADAGSGTGSSTGSGGTGGSGASGGTVGPGTGGMAPVIGPGSVPIAENAGPLMLRRLSHSEYNNTVQDLLGDTTNPADSWSVTDVVGNSGFDAPNNVNKLTLSRIEETANLLATTAVTQNRVTIPCTNPTAGAAETTCATNFIKTFGRRVYRRPVTAAEATDLLLVFSTARAVPISYDFKTSIAQVLSAMLQSPNFLYRGWEFGPVKPVRQGALVTLTPQQVASRLSYLIWESTPDNTLLDAADMGQLSTPDQIAAQAQRLLADKTHTTNSLFSFHVQWLQYYSLGQLTKDPVKYPLFTDAFQAALTPEISAFVSSVILGDGTTKGDGTLKTLLTAPYAYANAATAPAYGKTVTGTAMQRIALDPTQRAGILTQSAFLSTGAQAGNGGPHPIRRGADIYTQLLCGTIPAFNGMLPPIAEPDGVTIVTNRQQFSAHDTMPCATCHKAFDGLGFAFENYDGIGAYRQMDNGQAVDATGTVTTPIMKTQSSFKNGVELTNFLANNDEVKSCVARQWFRYLLGRVEVPEDEGSIQAAAKAAAANPGFSIPDLLVGMTRSMSFRMRVPNNGEPAI